MAITDITKVNKTNTDLIIPIFECKGRRESSSKEHLISSSHLLNYSYFRLFDAFLSGAVD